MRKNRSQPTRQNQSTSSGRSSFGRSPSFGTGANFGGLSVFSAGLNGVTAGLVGLKAAISLVEAGLSVLTKSATELVGAIAELGGAKGIRAMFVESVSNQQLINQTRFAVSGDERSTNKELTDLTAKLSENIQSGAFNRSEWLGAIKGIGVISGKQSSLDENTLSFLGKMATITGGSLQGQAEVFGRIQSQHPNMSNQDVIDTILAGHFIGQHGSFNMTELPEAHTLMGLSNRFTGNTMDIEKMLFSIGSVIKATGGVDLNTTGVQYQAFLNAAVAGKSSAFKFNQADQLTNPTEALENVVNTPENILATQLTGTGKLRVNARNFTDTLRVGVSQRAGVEADDFSPTANAARQKVIEDFTKLGGTMEDFRKEFESSITPQQRFRAAFNRISDQLEGKFYDVLIKMQQPMDHFADQIIANSDSIGSFFDNLVNNLSELISIIPNVITIITRLGTETAKVIEWILSHMPGLNFYSNKEDAQSAAETTIQDISTKQEQLANIQKDPNPITREENSKEKQAEIDKLYQDLADQGEQVSYWTAKENLSPAALAQNKIDIETSQQKDRKVAQEKSAEAHKPVAEHQKEVHTAKKQEDLLARLIEINKQNTIISQQIARNTSSKITPPHTSTSGK